MSKTESKSNAKKTERLGMPIGTAMNRLRKQIMFSLIQQLSQAVCYRCGKTIESAKELSIEHKEPWLNSNDPPSLFWDLDNIAFSHWGCNSGYRGVPTPRKRKPFYIWYKKDHKRWTGRLNLPTDRKHLGYYATKEEAQNAARQALQDLTSVAPCGRAGAGDEEKAMYKDTTESAKEVRKVLKAEYPNTKFSVRIKRFSMGSSVNVIWTDGPTEKEVADKTAHLKGGDYLNEYIMPHRRISRQVMIAATEACAQHYGIPAPEVKGGELNPYLTSLTLVGIAGSEAFCDRVHRATWGTSVYGVEPEEAFARVFPH